MRSELILSVQRTILSERKSDHMIFCAAFVQKVVFEHDKQPARTLRSRRH